MSRAPRLEYSTAAADGCICLTGRTTKTSILSAHPKQALRAIDPMATGSFLHEPSVHNHLIVPKHRVPHPAIHASQSLQPPHTLQPAQSHSYSMEVRVVLALNTAAKSSACFAFMSPRLQHSDIRSGRRLENQSTTAADCCANASGPDTSHGGSIWHDILYTTPQSRWLSLLARTIRTKRK